MVMMDVQLKKPVTVYCIEGLDGEIIAHAQDGPLIFPNPDDGQEMLKGRFKNCCVTSINVKARKGYSFTDYGANTIDGFKPPPGGMWMRQFRDMNDAMYEEWHQRRERERADPEVVPVRPKAAPRKKTATKVKTGPSLKELRKQCTRAGIKWDARSTIKSLTKKINAQKPTEAH